MCRNASDLFTFWFYELAFYQSWVSPTFLQRSCPPPPSWPYEGGSSPIWWMFSECEASPPEGLPCVPFRNSSQPQDSEVGVTSYVSFKSENSSLFYCTFQSKPWPRFFYLSFSTNSKNAIKPKISEIWNEMILCFLFWTSIGNRLNYKSDLFSDSIVIHLFVYVVWWYPFPNWFTKWKHNERGILNTF